MTKHYVATKIVQAWPTVKEDRVGYTVKYSDGYTSWCPKDKFEESNLELGHLDSLPSWRQRLIAEGTQLADRLEKLNDYLLTPHFKDLSDIERNWLIAQQGCMASYLNILNKREQYYQKKASN